MSKKDFDDYYNSVYASYLRLDEAYKKLQLECQTKMISQEDVDRFQQIIRPVIDSYNSLKYVKYLLDLPNDKNSRQRMSKQTDKVLNSIDDKYKSDAILKKNTESINKAKESI